jgi:hypothetical protein
MVIQVVESDFSEPRLIFYYLIDVKDFAAVNSKKYPFDPKCLLHSLQLLHKRHAACSSFAVGARSAALVRICRGHAVSVRSTFTSPRTTRVAGRDFSGAGKV